jgi:hypothetical protein
MAGLLRRRGLDLAPPRQSTPFDGRGAALLVLLATVLVLIPRFRSRR